VQTSVSKWGNFSVSKSFQFLNEERGRVRKETLSRL
jgi:hypothetical protein